MFPSGHFILLLKPFVAAAAGDFFRQLFSSHKSLIPRRTRPIYTSEKTPPKNSHPCTATHHSFPAACVPCACMCGHVWARGPLFGAEIPSLGSFEVVLLIHPSGGPPRALLIHLFNNFGSAAPPSIALLHGFGHFSSSQVPQP